VFFAPFLQLSVAAVTLSVASRFTTYIILSTCLQCSLLCINCF